MPADILTSSAKRFGPRLKTDGEVKSGFLVLLASGNLRQDVRVVVYNTTLEHFAVIYSRKRLSKPLGIINLRNATVEADRDRFVVRHGNDGTIAKAKFICSERETGVWVAAFASRSSSGLHSCLPVLEEDEES